MQSKILVGYASKYGSTQEVAETIAATLRENELIVDLRPLREVKTLEEYTAILLGAPLYMLHWHKEALGFLSQHREAITKCPVAVFALGPLGHDEKDWKEIREQLDKELEQFPWLRPITIGLFGGKFDPEKLHFPDKIIASLPASPLHKMPATDVRNWTVIRAWASNLVTLLQLTGPQ